MGFHLQATEQRHKTRMALWGAARQKEGEALGMLRPYNFHLRL
jgi:hypothetical protein